MVGCITKLEEKKTNINKHKKLFKKYNDYNLSY